MTTTLDRTPVATGTEPTVEPGTTLRRRATGAAFVGAGVVTMAGIVATPFEKSSATADYLTSLVDHPRQAIVAATLLHFGYLLFVPASYTMARLARRGARTLSAIGVVLATLGVGLSGLLVTDLYDLSIGLHSGTTGGVPTSEMTDVPFAPLGFIAIGMLTAVGSLIGLVLLAVAMRRARLAPLWPALAMLAGFATAFGAHEMWRNLIGFGALCTGIVALGVVVLRMGDERFDRGSDPR